MSNLPTERKLKLIVFRYFNFLYTFLQLIKYKVDTIYHKLRKNKKILLNRQSKNINSTEKKTNNSVCCIKSCLSFPTSDGFTLQYYDTLNYICDVKKHQVFLFCKKHFDQNKFLERYKNIKNVKFIENFPNNFSLIIPVLILQIILYKLGKKNHLFKSIETISKNSNYSFYIHDLSLYPLIFLNLKKENIVFSVTDFQTNRLFKMLKISKGIKLIYYFFGLVHCIIIESLLFRKIKTLHVYSPEDKRKMEKFFFIKNSISIPNFKLDHHSTSDLIKFKNNECKILIFGNLNEEEIFQGLKKLTRTKYFTKFSKRYNFVVKGKYSITQQSKIRKMINNIEFDEKWLNDCDFKNYLDSFKIILFIDSIAFGLSNRVLDALKSNTLVVGFKNSFTGYNLKNFESVIFLDNFFDLVYAYNLDDLKKEEIITKATVISKKFSISNIKSSWNTIL